MRDRPDDVVDRMARALRAGKVFVDRSQNDAGKSTVAPYSLRGLSRPAVSTPLGWDEVEGVASSGDPAPLAFLAHDVVARIERHGDLFAAAVTLEQRLPVAW